MATTLNTNATFPVAAPFNTNPPYSGYFVPTVWSSKLNAKFYKATVFGDIANTHYQGDISGMGDKVYIHTAPTITVSNYTAGSGVTYQVPTPDMQEMVIDKAKAFAFQINDVLEYQAKPNLLDMFTDDASEQMKIAVDSNVLYGTFNNGAAGLKGASAGLGGYNLGTDAAPVVLTGANVLTKILELASLLDEQNVPSSDRFLLIDPRTRTLLMQSNLAQAQFMGDATSPVRNGLVGTIDRFKVYVTNQLPRGAAGTGATAAWVSGDGTENTIQPAGTLAARRAIVAGHKSAITFASQMTKMETIRNPNDFGDYIRSLNVYGFKVIKADSLALMIAA
jgi:hypothetical protein